MKTFERLLGAHFRDRARGGQFYRRSDDALRVAREKGLPLDLPVTLPDGTTWRLCDQYADKDAAYANAPAKVNRYVLKEIKALPVRPAAKQKGGDA